MTPSRLHDALRYSHILTGAESATFDAAPAEHRRRCEVAIAELGDLATAEERVEELEEEVCELEHEIECKTRDLKDAEHKLEEERMELREAKRTINKLEDLIAENQAAVAASGTP